MISDRCLVNIGSDNGFMSPVNTPLLEAMLTLFMMISGVTDNELNFELP